MYCITCEKIFLSEETHVIYFTPTYLEPFNFEWCDGPFASCPPPEYDLDYWEWLFLQEPDEEFMEISNQGLMYSG